MSQVRFLSLSHYCCTSVCQHSCWNANLSFGPRSLEYVTLMKIWRCHLMTISWFNCFNIGLFFKWIFFSISFLSQMAILKKRTKLPFEQNNYLKPFSTEQENTLYSKMASKQCFNVHVIDAVVHNSSLESFLLLTLQGLFEEGSRRKFLPVIWKQWAYAIMYTLIDSWPGTWLLTLRF